MLAFPAAAAAAPPSAPAIQSPPVDGVVNAADVHMEAYGYSDSDGDPHQCTEWELYSVTRSEVAWRPPACTGGADKNHIHLGDGDFVNSHAGRSELFFDEPYRLRVRFKDSTGQFGPWSERDFRTAPLPPPGTYSDVPWLPQQPGFVVEVVTADLQLPVNLAFLPNPGSAPNSPLLYVAELYGAIKVVNRNGSTSTYAHSLLNFDPNGAFPGSGELGVTGLAVDPSTGDVLASTVYESGGTLYGKIDRFHSTDGGRTAATRTTVLDLRDVDPSTPQTASHQISNLSFGPDGSLFVHQGDALQPDQTQDIDNYLGKILRLDPVTGAPVGGPNGNPHYNPLDGTTARDYVYARGFRNPFGGAWRASNGQHYEVENGPNQDRLARVDFPPAAGGGVSQNFGFDGSDASMANLALFNWEPSHAPVNITFVEGPTFGGSGFPGSMLDHAFVTESGPTYAGGPQPRGKRIVEFSPGGSGELVGPPSTFVEYNGIGKATAAGLAAGPDGLYFTELYKDLNYTSPIDPGARLLRVRYCPECFAVDDPRIATQGSNRVIFGAAPKRKKRKKKRRH